MIAQNARALVNVLSTRDQHPSLASRNRFAPVEAEHSNITEASGWNSPEPCADCLRRVFNYWNPTLIT